MKFWYKYLVYLSLLFLTVALYNANYFKVPQIFSLPVLIPSFIFLFAGFISSTISWKQMLKKSNFPAALSECLAGVGLSIFGKYIPGKIWIIVGKAAYITQKKHYPLGKLSILSLNAQFISLWLGLLFGLIGLFFLGKFHLWTWLTLFALLGLTTVIFSRLVHRTVAHILKILFRKDITLPSLTFKSTISVMPWFVLNWVFWSIGFYILVVSLTAIDVPWSVGLGFPLAGTLGIMVFISPGGLGAREGVMVGYLSLAGIPVAEATTIAVASRLWFLAGELFIFTAGWIAHKSSNKATYEVGY